MNLQPDHGMTSYIGLCKLADRAAIITGGDSGADRALALAYMLGTANGIDADGAE